MSINNMTALVSCFARCYHHKMNKYKIFDDYMASKIISEEEYKNIASNMSNGIKFFCPEFNGDSTQALRWIVDNRLSPSVLGRSAFCEAMLDVATKVGCHQYLIFAAGYDTFAYRNNISNLKVFEIDKSDIINDKITRLKNNDIDISHVNYIKCDFSNKDWINNLINSNYDNKKISFSSLLGLSYYLQKNEFEDMIKNISKIVISGSSIVFDYPSYDGGIEALSNEVLAKGANEEMKAKYTYNELEKILKDNNFVIYEHLENNDITNKYFKKYNDINVNNKIIAPRGICYVLAVKE